MKFTYTGGGINNYYGLTLTNGQEIDESRESIIAKMENHPDFESGSKPSSKPAQEVDEELQAARDVYEKLAGKKPHHKAGLDKIKADIAALEADNEDLGDVED